MAKVFNPAPHQPLVVFFDLTLGPLKRIYQDPEIPLSFDVRMSIYELPTFRVSLFDETGEEVEPHIWKARNEDGMPGGTFKFGYQGKAKEESPDYKFVLDGYTPVYQNGAYVVTIFGQIAGSLGTSNNQISGTFEEVVKEIAKLHELDHKIVPDLGKTYMKEIGVLDDDVTEKREMKHRKNLSENDWRYLLRLCEYARDQEGKAGFKPIVVPTKSGEKPTIIISRQQNNSADYKIIVQDEDSTVIDYRFNVTYSGVFGESDYQHNGHQKLTGDTTKHAIAQKVTKKFVEQMDAEGDEKSSPYVKATPESGDPDKIPYYCAEDMPDNIKNSVRMKGMASGTPHGKQTQNLNNHARAWGSFLTLEITIAGDPNIVPADNQGFKTCEVEFYNPVSFKSKGQRKKHYTSGIWCVEAVEHHIEPGSFTTKLTLAKPSFPEEPGEVVTSNDEEVLIPVDGGETVSGGIGRIG